MLNQANIILASLNQVKQAWAGLLWFFLVLLMSCFSQPFLQSRLWFMITHNIEFWSVRLTVLVCCCCVFLTIWFELVQLWSWPVMLMPCAGCKIIDLPLGEDRSSWFHVFKHSLSGVFWNGVQRPPPQGAAGRCSELRGKIFTLNTIFTFNTIKMHLNEMELFLFRFILSKLYVYLFFMRTLAHVYSWTPFKVYSITVSEM